MLQHQLPVHSPIPFGALPAAAWAALGLGQDPRPRLLVRLLRNHRAVGGTLVDSGTSALRIALAILRENGRDPVALPTFTCWDVATAAVGAGVRVRFYDLDPRTLSPDPGSLERALDEGARSAVISPLHGFPVDWEAIRRGTVRHDAVVVEDAAQAHGGSFRGTPSGRFGDLVVMSLGRGKGWTGGRGGALMVRDARWLDALADRPPLPEPVPLEELGDLVRAGAQWALGRPSLYGIPRSVPSLGLGETHYREPEPPRAMGRVSAAAALASRRAADQEVEVRRRNARHYRELLEEVDPAVEPVRPVGGGESGYLRLPVLLSREEGTPSGESPWPGHRATALGAERSYPRALPDLPALAGNGGGPPPRSHRRDAGTGTGRLLARRLVTLPTHSLTTREERRFLVEALRDAPAADTAAPSTLSTPRERTSHG